MSKTNAETMTVRIPTQIANELIKLRDDKNLPTIGSALQIYIQKMKEDQLIAKLDFILDEIKIIEDRAIRTDEKATITAVYLATVLQQLDGKDGAKSYIDRLEKIVQLDIHELLEQRKTRYLKVAEHRKSGGR